MYIKLHWSLLLYSSFVTRYDTYICSENHPFTELFCDKVLHISQQVMGLIELVISSANMKLFIILKLAWDGMNWVTGKSQMLTCWH